MTAQTSKERLQEAESLIAMLSNDMDQHDFTRGYLPHWRPRLRAFLEGRPATYDPKDAPPRHPETSAECAVCHGHGTDARPYQLGCSEKHPAPFRDEHGYYEKSRATEVPVCLVCKGRGAFMPRIEKQEPLT